MMRVAADSDDDLSHKLPSEVDSIAVSVFVLIFVELDKHRIRTKSK